MPVFPLGGAILLKGMRAGDKMSNTNGFEEGFESLILPSPVRLNNNNLPVE